MSSDDLVRIRTTKCQEECRACAAVAGKGGADRQERDPCMRDIPCTRRVHQQHGSVCCTWVERPGAEAAVAMQESDEDIDARADRHSAELFRRLRWCIDKGPDFWPANKFIHLAPGDDSAFGHGIAPVRSVPRSLPRSVPRLF